MVTPPLEQNKHSYLLGQFNSYTTYSCDLIPLTHKTRQVRIWTDMGPCKAIYNRLANIKPFTVITEKNGWYLKFWEIKSRIHGFIQFWIWIALDFEKAMAKSMWLLAILNKNPPNLAFLFWKRITLIMSTTLDWWSGFKFLKKIINTF